MSSLAPVDGDGAERPSPLDDLLPAARPGDGPAGVPDAPPPAGSPEPDPPSRAEIEEIQSLHDEVLRASAACESSMFGGKGRRHLRAVQRSEDTALRKLGCTSYADFALVAGATGEPRADTTGPVAEPTAPGFDEAPAPEPMVAAAVDAPPATTWRAELTQLQPREPDRAERIQRELDETRLALRLSQEDLDRARADLADATTVRDATDTAAETTMAELEQVRARAELATAEAAQARQELEAARAEVERQRHALTEAGTAASADGAAHRQRIEQLEERVSLEQGARVAAEAEAVLANEQLAVAMAEVEDLQHRVGTSTEDLEAQLGVVRDEAARAVDEAARHQEARGAELEAQLAEARELVAQASTEVERAVRSRDAAVDEVANGRTQLDELGAELAAARSELAQVRQDQEHAVLDTVEATARAEALHTAELERAAADLAELRNDAAAAEERRAAEVDAVRTELDAAHADVDAARAEIEALTETLAEASREPEPVEPVEPAAVAIAAVDELVRVSELARARVEAEAELTDLADRVEQLQDKRRRLKRRIEQQRTRFAAERAALDRELAWNREQAGAQLAALEHHVAAVSTDAEHLRAQLAAARAAVPTGDPGGPAGRR